MKKTILILIGALILINCNIAGSSPDRAAPDKDISQQGNIQIYSKPEFTDLAQKWTDLYSAENTKANVQILALDKLKISEGNLSKKNWALVSDCDNEELCSEAAWKMLVGRDPVIAVTSSNNPFLKKINEVGLSKETIRSVLSAETTPIWGKLLGTNSSKKIEVYLEDQTSVSSTTIGYTGLELNSLSNKRVKNGYELSKIIARDPYAISFIRLSEILTDDKASFIEGIALIPIDNNSNGKVDSFENIYANSQSFFRGLWIGKYPRTLITNLYLISNSEPQTEEEVSFLTFLMLKGDEILAESNFISLVNEEAFSSITKLEKSELPEDMVAGNKPVLTILIVLGIFVLLMLIPAVIRIIQNRKTTASRSYLEDNKVLSPSILKKPQGVLFDKSHTWAFMEKDGKVKIGIDDFLQHVVGPITRVKLLNIGDKVSKGEKIIVLSNMGKQVTIKSPVTGIIADLNETIKSNPSLLNKSPHEEGWIYTIEPTNWQSENQIMLMGSQYMDWLRTEFSQLKDFLLWALKENQGRSGQLVLTDGGEIPDETLNLLGAEIWEEFQEKFIDKTKKL